MSNPIEVYVINAGDGLWSAFVFDNEHGDVPVTMATSEDRKGAAAIAMDEYWALKEEAHVV